MTIKVDEFLYRGPHSKNGNVAGWHVVLVEETTDVFGGIARSFSGALTPEQAEALGFPLPVIINAINTTVLAERDALKTERDALKTERDALKGPKP